MAWLRLGLRSVALTAALVAACASDEDRASTLDDDCVGGTDAGCKAPPGSGGGSKTPGNDGGAVSDASGSDVVVDGGTATVSGSFFAYNDVFGVANVSFDAEAIGIYAEAPDGTFLEENVDGFEGYEVSGVAFASDAWLGGQVLTNDTTYFKALQPLNTFGGAVHDLGFVQRSTLDLISNTLSNPVVVDDNGAHIVVQFVDAAGVPLQGVTINSSLGAERVVYDTDGGWTDIDGEATGVQGLAVLYNIPGLGDLPGSEESISYNAANGATCALLVRVARDAVTLFAVQGHTC